MTAFEAFSMLIGSSLLIGFLAWYNDHNNIM